MIRKLKINQTHDPARGSFLVNPMPITGKRLHGQQVYCSAVHTDRQGVAHPHPGSYQFTATNY